MGLFGWVGKLFKGGEEPQAPEPERDPDLEMPEIDMNELSEMARSEIARVQKAMMDRNATIRDLKMRISEIKRIVETDERAREMKNTYRWGAKAGQRMESAPPREARTETRPEEQQREGRRRAA
jgi:hypothetical protein